MQTLTEVNKNQPCVHCGKPDWCYTLANGASVCNRGNIASGWVASGKKDKQGADILWPDEWKGKPPDPKVISRNEWIYKGRIEPYPTLVKVLRSNLDNGKNKMSQRYWDGSKWLPSRPVSLQRYDIPVYRYPEIRQAIKEDRPIFIVEGEKCADRLWEMGLAATTNIQGCKSWSATDINDVSDAK